MWIQELKNWFELYWLVEFWPCVTHMQPGLCSTGGKHICFRYRTHQSKALKKFCFEVSLAELRGCEGAAQAPLTCLQQDHFPAPEGHHKYTVHARQQGALTRHLSLKRQRSVRQGNERLLWQQHGLTSIGVTMRGGPPAWLFITNSSGVFKGTI